MSVIRDWIPGAEATLQFVAYAYLCDQLPQEVAVYPEVRVPSEIHRSGYMRVDLALTTSEGVIGVIEVKKEGQRMSASCRQARAYRSLARDYNVQLYFLNSIADLGSLVERIRLDLRTILPGLHSYDSGADRNCATSGAPCQRNPGQASEGQYTATA